MDQLKLVPWSVDLERFFLLLYILYMCVRACERVRVCARVIYSVNERGVRAWARVSPGGVACGPVPLGISRGVNCLQELFMALRGYINVLTINVGGKFT